MGKKKNGKAKGNRFELYLARLLSKWWGQEDTDNLRAEQLWFRRTPMSGGFEKRAASADLWAVSDEAKNFPFALEAKFRQEWSWDKTLKGSAKDPVISYWKQACDSAISVGKEPLLVVKRNNADPYFIIRDNLLPNPMFKFRLVTTGEYLSVFTLEQWLLIQKSDCFFRKEN